MILPDKFVKLSGSMIGIGALILPKLDTDNTVSSLWNEVRLIPGISNYEVFILALDFLFVIGLIEFNDGLLRRSSKK
jgi:hypothetical protein